MKRVTADLSVHIDLITTPIKSFIVSQGHHDVSKIFGDLPRNSKSNPRLSVCAHFAPMYAQLAACCGNGQLAPQKTLCALKDIFRCMKCNFTTVSDDELVSDVSLAIRVGFTKYRALLDAKQYAISLAKAYHPHPPINSQSNRVYVMCYVVQFSCLGQSSQSPGVARTIRCDRFCAKSVGSQSL